MKAILCLTFILFCTVCFANEIDKLKTNDDVSNFLVKRISKKFKEFPLLKNDPAQTDTAAFGRNKFFKVDIDDNKLTDLVVYGYQQLVVILDAGSNNYEVRYLDGGAFQRNNARLISIDTIGSQKKIIIQQFERTADAYDTLVYLFNNFIEYNPNPGAAFNFETITFKTNPCFGECPVFKITINKDRSATYTAIRYNEQSGSYSGTVPKKDFDDLLLLMQYLQFDKLKNNYAVPWSDSQTATTEISYSGKLKTITDYGEIGTFGLNLLYLRFFRFRTAVDWYDK
jgi:hypothetical protein